ncbi:MAG TPA: DinB family protein [Gemmatimonadaceae bacterium]|nr:DinB family protein [Gemmatimonadaceae bacterium]
MAPKKQVKKQVKRQMRRPVKAQPKKPVASAAKNAASAGLAREFLAELDAELKVTRRCIERVPSERAQWKPHPTSMAMGHLTQLICKMVRVLADIPKGVNLDLKSGIGYSFEETPALLAEFDANEKNLRASLAAVKPEDWSKNWSVVAGDHVLSTSPRKDAMRNTINHFVHHRGQLTVYMRMAGVKIPSLYGPSADENG